MRQEESRHHLDIIFSISGGIFGNILPFTMDPGDLKVHHHCHTITRDKGSSVFKYVAKVIHFVLEVIPIEPIRAVQHKLFGDYFRGSDEVVRCTVRNVPLARRRVVMSSLHRSLLRASVPFGLLLLLDHGHH